MLELKPVEKILMFGGVSIISSPIYYSLIIFTFSTIMCQVMTASITHIPPISTLTQTTNPHACGNACPQLSETVLI